MAIKCHSHGSYSDNVILTEDYGMSEWEILSTNHQFDQN